jgi:hypothetical protein
MTRFDEAVLAYVALRDKGIPLDDLHEQLAHIREVWAAEPIEWPYLKGGPRYHEAEVISSMTDYPVSQCVQQLREARGDDLRGALCFTIIEFAEERIYDCDDTED